MKFATLLTMKRVAVKCLCVWTLAAVACADGGALPTSPSASLPLSNLAASGDEASRPNAAAPSASSGLDRLVLEKTCADNLPSVRTCTVVTSIEGPLPVGTTALYDFKVIDFGCHEKPTQPGCQLISGNLVLTTPDNKGTAAGHCTLSLKTGSGTCTFAQGTGELAGFHANVKVTFDFRTFVTTWDGTYHFSGRV